MTSLVDRSEDILQRRRHGDAFNRVTRALGLLLTLQPSKTNFNRILNRSLDGRSENPAPDCRYPRSLNVDDQLSFRSRLLALCSLKDDGAAEAGSGVDPVQKDGRYDGMSRLEDI